MIEKMPPESEIHTKLVDDGYSVDLAGHLITARYAEELSKKLNEIIDYLNRQESPVYPDDFKTTYSEEHQEKESPCEICGDRGHTEIACENRK